MANLFSDNGKLVEGNSSGLRYLSAFFVLVGWKGGDWHLDRVERDDPGYGLFDHGTQVVLLDGKYNGPPRFKVFKHEARPVLTTGPKPLLPGSECWTTDGDLFVIDGNMEAHLSFAGHLLDLAEVTTPVGTEVSYRPGHELLVESTAFRFKRTA